MFEILSFSGLFVLTQFLKKYIVPRYGATGVHVFVFLTAFVIISAKGFATEYPPFNEMLLLAGQYLAGSLALYKVILKPLNETFNLL